MARGPSQWNVARMAAEIAYWDPYDRERSPQASPAGVFDRQSAERTVDAVAAREGWQPIGLDPNRYTVVRDILTPKLATAFFEAELLNPDDAATAPPVGSISGFVEMKEGVGRVMELTVLRSDSKEVTSDFLRKIPTAELRQRIVASQSFTSDPSNQTVLVEDAAEFRSLVEALHEPRPEEAPFPFFADPRPFMRGDGVDWFPIYVTQSASRRLDKIKRNRDVPEELLRAFIRARAEVLDEGGTAAQALDAACDAIQSLEGKRPSRATAYRYLKQAKELDQADTEGQE